MPHAIKRDKELSKIGLVTILMESQNSEDIEAFMYKTFPTNGCMVTKRSIQLPIKSTSNGLPSCALIGVDGTLLAEGSLGNIGGKLPDLIDAELRKAAKGWGASKDLKKVRSMLYGKKKDIAGALALAKKIQASNDEETADLALVMSEIDTKIATLEKSAKYLREQGLVSEGLDAAEDFAKAAKGDEAREASAKELLASFQTPEAKAELALEKKLTKIERMVSAAGVSGREIPALQKLAKGNEETKVGARALRLAGFFEKATAK